MDELRKVYDILMPRLQASEDLEKQASEKALITKAGTDLATIGLLKHAATGPLMKGLMYGAGASVPVGLMGAGLISHAGGESRKTIEDARNKALQAALGIAAMGGGLYALHRTMGAPQQDQVRQASVQEPELLVEKLATVAFLDTLFEEQRTQNADEATRQKAAECQLLNAEHGVDILRQLLD
jgi:hypothetical protein